MPVSNVFGPMVDGDDVVEAVLATLRRWERDYLAEKERQEGLDPGALPRIQEWAGVGDRRYAPDLDPPSVLVVTAGLAQKPDREGDGTYSAWFACAFVVEVEVNSRDQRQANRVAQWYCAAFRTLLLQQKDLGGFAAALEWSAEAYDELDVGEDADCRAQAGGSFLVRVGDVARDGAGPLEPSSEPVPDPPDDPPIAETVIVTIDPEE